MVAKTILLVLFACLLAGCGASQPTPAITPTLPPASTNTPLPTDTPPPSPALLTFTETMTEVPSDTPPPPAVTSTVDPLIATSVAQLGPLGALVNISQYYHPTGAPVQTWRDVPVMPQATAGQEYPPYVYSYTANATLDEAKQFYAPKAAALGITFPSGSGSAGTGANAVHNVSFLSPTMAIVLTSFDNDPSHVIVTIAKAP